MGGRYASDGNMVKEARPGPGAYEETVSALGKQTLSKNSNVPEVRIGTGQRFAQQKNAFKAEYRTPDANNPRWVNK